MSMPVGRRVGAILIVMLLLSVVLVPAASASNSPVPSLGCGSTSCGCSPVYYRVRPGDNLTRIAARYGTTVWKLVQLNHLANPDCIYIGHRLLIRACSPCPSPCPPPKPPCPSPCPPPKPACPPSCPPASPPWRGEYFDNRDLEGAPVMVRSDRYINFNWGYSSPIPQFCQGDFSVRWTKSQHFPAGGYQGIATADDGIRVWVDGELLIDAWVEQPATTYTADFELEAGSHDLVVEYFESVPRPASAFFTIARLW